ncbi:MAG: 7-carboxy-7-deazaguanine synthase QueE [Flavobacteriales bacterium Tduv]
MSVLDQIKNFDSFRVLSDEKNLRFPVMEAFYSIQGEGSYSGVAAYFIRLGGCDVGCHWCDVKESWVTKKHEFLSVDQIIGRVDPGAQIVVITGGEPLMCDLGPLTEGLKTKGYRIHLETSGAYPLSGVFDWVCLSPKKRKLPFEAVYQKVNELKVVVYNRHDFFFAEEQSACVSASCVLFFQPEWSRSAVMLPLIIDYVKAHPRWRVSLQIHKFLDIP